MAGKRVLIVDDHARIRAVLRSLLEDDGFEVWEASNGAEGVQQAQEVVPDLVILDLTMPVMNGLEAARHLNKLLPQIPVLMFTNTERSVVEHEASAAGVTAVVQKSEGAVHLLGRANALLN